MNYKKLIITIIFLAIFNNIKIAYPISASMKSEKNYIMAIELIRHLSIIISNFGTKEQKDKFSEIRNIFIKASQQHYAREFARPGSFTDEIPADNNFISSVDIFMQFKLKAVLLYDVIASNYIKRAKEILDSTSKQSFEIIIKYSPKSGHARYFYEPINPLTDKKPYDPRKYHYFHDRTKIETYLKMGYKYLQDAINIYENADLKYVKSKKEKRSVDLNYLIKKYNHIIKITRQSKQYGLEIHKILKQSELDLILRKHDITMGAIRKHPIYDDRIPKEYKIDLVDNKKMLFELEKKRMTKQ